MKNKLPRGRTLADEDWSVRHGRMLALLCLHVPAVFIFGVGVGATTPHALFEAAAVGMFAALALIARDHRRLAAGAVTIGLLTASATITHLSHGQIEAHFHFLLMVTALALYEDWAIFGVAVGFVALHHGIVGTLDAERVFNHADGIAHPWKWGLIHGAFVAGFGAVSIAGWSTAERSRRAAVAQAEHAVAAQAEAAIAWQATASRLAKAVEFRDNETAEHVERMSAYCEALARSMGQSPQRCAQIRAAAVLHDAGKVAIPDSVLLKPGPLTHAERAEMEEHARIGYELLRDTGSPLLDLAAEIALTHHERWDGRGYPHGVKGLQIPLPGRIAAVADVFDALTSKRPYRDAYPVGEAVRMMCEESPGHFDPEVLAALLSCLPDLGRIARAADELAERSPVMAVA